jgi:hypothetical protein
MQPLVSVAARNFLRPFLSLSIAVALKAPKIFYTRTLNDGEVIPVSLLV